jgi:AcrR family transcriptional regulator
MGRKADTTRQRILEAAYGLFYRVGFARAGVDEIADAAGVTKRTLYYHFRSKDDLLAAVLAEQSALALGRFRRHEAGQMRDPGRIVSAIFADLDRWSRKPGWTGAGFTRIAMELADMPGHPARIAARQHKASMETWWTAALRNAGVSQSRARAREIVLLMEGTMAMILISGDRSYAAAAGAAARKLLGRR